MPVAKLVKGTRLWPVTSSKQTQLFMPVRPPASRGLPVPSSRLGRLTRFGGLAANVAGSVFLEGAGRLARGERPRLSDLLLTPANVLKVTEQLAQLRGAAMKVGQLLSMDAGEVLPPELSGIMARLRADAEPMPERQLRAVLDANWGRGWGDRFERFDFQPVAAASIGQVHRACLRNGRELAVKVQYPGVRQSIDSDVDNVAALLRLSGLVPGGINVKPLLTEAKRQLHEEADYSREAECLRQFGTLLASDPDFLVPAVESEFTTGSVLAMAFAEGVSIETLSDAPQAERDRVATLLIDLFLRELFAFGLMQTDPNFANYLFQPETGRIVLLDFGATRAFAPDVVERFRRLGQAGMAADRQAARQAMLDIGFFDEGSPRIFQAAVLVMFETAFKPIRTEAVFDFADPSLVQSLREQVMVLAERRDALRAPPVDALFLQRKAGGMFLLASRMKARIPVRALLAKYLDKPQADIGLEAGLCKR